MTLKCTYTGAHHVYDVPHGPEVRSNIMQCHDTVDLRLCVAMQYDVQLPWTVGTV